MTTRMESQRGGLVIAACRSTSYLAAQVADRCRDFLAGAGVGDPVDYLKDIDFRFSDSETCVRLDSDVNGQDVFLFQSLYAPDRFGDVDRNLMSFLIAARTFKEWGAAHITAVLPYLAYGRQDNPSRNRREPTTAKLVADLAMEAGIDRLITLHPHCKVHALFGKIPVLSLDSLPIFEEEFSGFLARADAIAVAPDAGAAKFVAEFSRLLDLRMATASKYRPRPEEAMVHELSGEFHQKKTAIILDDMISSGGTVYALIRKLVEERNIEEVYLGVTHNLCLEPALERLVELNSRYRLKAVITTDSIPQATAFTSLPFARVKPLDDFLSKVIARIHYDVPVMEAPA